MNWQPIQMPTPGGPLEGMKNFGDAVARYQEQKRLREQQMYANLMAGKRQQLDEQEFAARQKMDAASIANLSADNAQKAREARTNAILKARAIYRTDPDAAMEILRGAGATGLGAEDLYEQPPQQPQAPQVPQVEAEEAPMPPGKFAPMQRGAMPPPAATDTEANAAAEGGQPPMNPLMAGVQKSRERNARMYTNLTGKPFPGTQQEQPRGRFLGKKLTYKFDDQQGNLDPRAAIQLEDQARSRRTALFETMQNDPNADWARRALAADADLDKVMDVYSKMTERQTNRENANTEHELNRKARHEDTKMIADAMRAGSNMRGAAQESASDRGWHSQAESTLKNYLGTQGYTKNVESLRGYESMLADLESGNTAQMAGGLGAWIKEKSGGSAVVTDNEIKRYATDAIPWNERVQKEFDYWTKGGKVSPEYVKPFTEALRKSVIARQRDRIDQIGQGAKAALLADPNPEIRARADSAYMQLVTPLMSKPELQTWITEREAQVAEPTGGAPAPGKAKGATALPKHPFVRSAEKGKKLNAARAWLADPANASNPKRAQVEAGIQAMEKAPL